MKFQYRTRAEGKLAVLRFSFAISNDWFNSASLTGLPWTAICLGYPSVVVYFSDSDGNLQTLLFSEIVARL